MRFHSSLCHHKPVTLLLNWPSPFLPRGLCSCSLHLKHFPPSSLTQYGALCTGIQNRPGGCPHFITLGKGVGGPCRRPLHSRSLPVSSSREWLGGIAKAKVCFFDSPRERPINTLGQVCNPAFLACDVVVLELNSQRASLLPGS